MKITLISMLSVVQTPPKSYGGSELLHWQMAKMFSQFDNEVTLIALKGSQTPPKGSLIEIEPLGSYSELNFGREIDRLIGNKAALDAIKSADIVWDCSDYKQGAQYIFDKTNHKRALPYYTNGVYFAYPELHYNCVGESKTHAQMAIQNASGYEGFKFPDAAEMTRGLLMDECEYLYPPVDESDFIYREEFKESYFLTLGRFSEDKGQELVLDIASRLPNEKFVIAGSTEFEGHKAYFEGFIKPLAEKLSNVQLILNPTQEQKRQLLTDAKGTIMPSGLKTGFLESFGVVAVESLLSGTPVIITPLGTLPEIVTNKKSGFVFMNDFQLMNAVFNIQKVKRSDCRNEGKRFNYSECYSRASYLMSKVQKGEYWK